jgi:hypothetical protein
VLVNHKSNAARILCRPFDVGFQFLASSARALLLLCGSVLAGIEQVFTVLSDVEVSTGVEKQPLRLRRPKAVYVITPLSAKFGATSILQPELVSLEEL